MEHKEKKIITINCCLCSYKGGKGDLFYIGKENFTGEMAYPSLCKNCFKRRADVFFNQFETITHHPLVMTETILDDDSMNIDYRLNVDKLVKHLNLSSPYTKFGEYRKTWYYELLKDLLFYSKKDKEKDVLIKARFIKP